MVTGFTVVPLYVESEATVDIRNKFGMFPFVRKIHKLLTFVTLNNHSYKLCSNPLQIILRLIIESTMQKQELFRARFCL